MKFIFCPKCLDTLKNFTVLQDKPDTDSVKVKYFCSRCSNKLEIIIPRYWLRSDREADLYEKSKLEHPAL